MLNKEESSADFKGATTTVLDDEINYNIKHPLERQWTLWFDGVTKNRNAEKEDWMANLKKLITIGTVEDFWGVMNTIAACNEIPYSANYHFFVDGILPQWEDERNKNGGKWVMEFDKGRAADFVSGWQNLLLGLIGENFPSSDQVCGAVASVRPKQYRIAVWVKNSPTRQDSPHSEIIEKTKQIGRDLIKLMEVKGNKTDFISHADAASAYLKRAPSMFSL